MPGFVARAVSALLAIVAASAACAGSGSSVERIVARLEANPADCNALPPTNPQRRAIEDAVTAFRAAVPQAAGVAIDVLDCAADGFVHAGRIVVSARMARLTPAQRFFIVAHEFGHLRLEHHASVSGFVARVVDEQPDEAGVRLRLAADLPALSHRNEFAADAYAVALMRGAGLDPGDAARLFDAIGPGADGPTHPAPRRRADAIRRAAD